MLNQFLGAICILVGLFLIVSVAWVALKKSQPPNMKMRSLAEANAWDALIVLINKLPWIAVVGLALVVAGLRLLNVV